MPLTMPSHAIAVDVKAKLNQVFLPDEIIQDLLSQFNGGFFRRRKALSRYKDMMTNAMQIQRYLLINANNYALQQSTQQIVDYCQVVLQMPTIEKDSQGFFIKNTDLNVFEYPADKISHLEKLIGSIVSPDKKISPQVQIITSLHEATGESISENIDPFSLLDLLYANQAVITELSTSRNDDELPLFTKFCKETGLPNGVPDLIRNIVTSEQISSLT